MSSSSSSLYSVFLVLLLITYSDQFLPDEKLGTISPRSHYHTTITRAALRTVAQQYFNDRRSRIKPIATTDPATMFSIIYGDQHTSTNFELLTEDIGISIAKVDYDQVTREDPSWHFDAEQFKESHDNIIRHYKALIKHIENDDYQTARQQLNILHAVQDFYSHSNWLEMGHTEPNPRIGVPGAVLDPYATKNDFACKPCDRTWKDRLYSMALYLYSLVASFDESYTFDVNRIFTCYDNIVTDKLTSGYYSNRDDSSGAIKPSDIPKCSHGGITDTKSDKHPVGGINKDADDNAFSPHHYLHFQAAAVAKQATVDFFNRIRTGVGDDRFAVFLQLKPDGTYVPIHHSNNTSKSTDRHDET